MKDLKAQLGLKDSWLAKLVRPFAGFLADLREYRAARIRLNRFEIWGYTATWTGTGSDAVIVQALKSGKGKRKIVFLTGSFLKIRGSHTAAVIKAWLARDPSADGYFRKGVGDIFEEIEKKNKANK